MTLRGEGERPDVAHRVDLRVERAVRGAEDAVGQDRNELAGLVPIEELHRHPVRRPVFDELAHDRALGFARE